MPMHPLAEQFAQLADVYERGRPDYQPAVVGAIAAELRLQPGARVLDLGAGTGKLTRALLEQGLDVIAVEPHEPLCEHIARTAGPDRVKNGTAESIPLADGSVAGVTVADAFHWFDAPVALREIGRVLKPKGGLAILRSVPDWSGTSWGHEVGSMLAGLRPEHPQFDGPSWKEKVRDADGWSPPREVQIITEQPADVTQIRDYVSSISWVAALPDSERHETLQRVSALVSGGETPETLRVRTTIYFTSRA